MSGTNGGPGDFAPTRDPRTSTLYAPSSRRKANDYGRLAVGLLFAAWAFALVWALVKLGAAIGQAAGWL